MTDSHTKPTIKGLVLIGGKSARMGKDKSELNYHGTSQKEFAKQLLEDQGIKTFYSVGKSSNLISSARTEPALLADRRSRSEVEKSQLVNKIHDVIPNLGPFGGIYSAFQQDANSAWLVLATDLPFVNKELIELLLEKRNPEKIATVVQGKNKEFPEPLIAIYESKIYPILQNCLNEGNLSLVKILMNLDIQIVEVNDTLIRNVNTLEEYNTIKKELNNVH